ncbi:hypothetical protein L1987_68970 [Smallanthus sonchifolius]|uniref:Uncharacterized protein n=1 Tax=Smallanthus sonchifolius TaxID=185202 RepID=A0ACB9B6I5_9ASTR|nr:hypothetical protein L1987_68970 [Smallanthus sonchifolius]
MLFEDLHFSTDSLHSLEKLDLCILSPDDVEVATRIFGLLQHLHRVKFLQLNLELVQDFSVPAEYSDCDISC